MTAGFCVLFATICVVVALTSNEETSIYGLIARVNDRRVMILHNSRKTTGANKEVSLVS